MKNLIKVERARFNLSQTDLATKVGVTRQTIYAIEQGKFLPSVLLAFKIATVLNIEVSELFIMEDFDFDQS
ncbi:helix-turn-helix transcriptional regulator [Marivirga harenae]|uniref:helix-turn-helix transcriptional regulator n=1 Tax=Marivirga harenae TaxID=2010992 RepID=UPI0026E0AA94|nr:helix-turn-helix transcriptional regulator [Marivirga harenae]WKV10952.1 helix-turn-helix transcriptional regulator [Marivirga harenae]